MYRLNITFVVEHRVQERWLELLRDKFIPYIKGAGFSEVVFSRVISVEAADHFTYSLLVGFGSMVDYERLVKEVWPEYLAVAEGLFGVQVLWYHSLLKEV